MRNRTKVTILAVLALLLVSVVAAIQPVFACEWPGCEPPPPPCCDQPCVRSPGYWMNHPEEWPVEEITIGGVPYSVDAAIEIMMRPVRGDKTLTMFPALVAAMLNVANHNRDCGRILDVIADADAWLTEFPVGSGVRGSSEAWQASHGERLYLWLDNYNNGHWCAPSCDLLEDLCE